MNYQLLLCLEYAITRFQPLCWHSTGLMVLKTSPLAQRVHKTKTKTTVIHLSAIYPIRAQSPMRRFGHRVCFAMDYLTRIRAHGLKCGITLGPQSSNLAHRTCLVTIAKIMSLWCGGDARMIKWSQQDNCAPIGRSLDKPGAIRSPPIEARCSRRLLGSLFQRWCQRRRSAGAGKVTSLGVVLKEAQATGGVPNVSNQTRYTKTRS